MFTCFNTTLPIISLAVIIYKTASLRRPARGDSLKDYPAPAYNKVGQP